METNVEAPSGTAAPYGHACANCAKAKCKCILRHGGACERCHRLGKQCSPAAQVRKRGVKKSTATSRRAQLEDKLDDLVTLLQAQRSEKQNANTARSHGAHPTPESLDSIWPPSSEEITSVLPRAAEEPSAGGHGLQSLMLTPTPPASRSQSNASPISTAAITSATISRLLTKDADHILQIFRTHYLRYFPLIYLPSIVTSEEIQQNRPYLWLNILSICTQSLRGIGELGIQIRETLAKRAIVEGERSIELLQGLITHVSWTQYFARSGKPYMGILSNIAKSLVSDLRLDGPHGDAPAPAFSCPKPGMFLEQTPNMTSRTHEERRCLLASYVMSSTVSALLKYEPWRWEGRMEESAMILSENPDWVGDQVLAAISRITRVADDALKVMLRGYEYTGPVTLHIKPLRTALERVKASLSSDLLSNKVILSYLYNAEVTIHEIPLFQRASTGVDRVFDYHRHEYLWTCLQASKSLVDTYLSIEIPEHRGINIFVMMHCLHGVQSLHRLTILDDPAWDRAAVRRTADVIFYLDQIVQLLDRIHEHIAPEVDEGYESVWSKGADKLRRAIPNWVSAIEKEGAAALDQDVGAGTEGSLFDPTVFNFSEEPFLQDLFAPSFAG